MGSPCHIREIRLDQDLSSLSEGWKKCNSRFHDHSIHCDPDWIDAHFKRRKKDVQIYFLERDGEVIGAVPFVLSQEPLLCRLGPSIIAKLPLRSLKLQGYTPNLPAKASFMTCCFIKSWNPSLMRFS